MQAAPPAPSQPLPPPHPTAWPLARRLPKQRPRALGVVTWSGFSFPFLGGPTVSPAGAVITVSVSQS